MKQENRSRSVFNLVAHSVLQKILSVVKLISNQQKCKIHYYQDGQGYAINPQIKENPNQAHMTPTGKGVKNGDCICIQSTKSNGTDQWYQINDIDYYSNPRDMFIALIEKTTNSTCRK